MEDDPVVESVAHSFFINAGNHSHEWHYAPQATKDRYYAQARNAVERTKAREKANGVHRP